MIRAVDIRAKLLLVHDWILPTASIRKAAQWNSVLITVQNVEAVYATTPWQYLTDMVPPLTFVAEAATFAPHRLRYQRHQQNRARAYWEATRCVPFPKDPAFAPCARTQSNVASDAATLEDALKKADMTLKWCRFFLPLGSTQPAVDPEHPAFTISRLKQKIVQEL
ncbi:hypothetical protein BBJ28_00020590 [Nothophytophthora sp. Chile5]|nr:hypothetical protein BBJ28_00020590 [Nothophytophthora sp. Chile5]